jgi:hypothetical protein
MWSFSSVNSSSRWTFWVNKRSNKRDIFSQLPQSVVEAKRDVVTVEGIFSFTLTPFFF